MEIKPEEEVQPELEMEEEVEMESGVKMYCLCHASNELWAERGAA